MFKITGSVLTLSEFIICRRGSGALALGSEQMVFSNLIPCICGVSMMYFCIISYCLSVTQT